MHQFVIYVVEVINCVWMLLFFETYYTALCKICFCFYRRGRHYLFIFVCRGCLKKTGNLFKRFPNNSSKIHFVKLALIVFWFLSQMIYFFTCMLETPSNNIEFFWYFFLVEKANGLDVWCNCVAWTIVKGHNCNVIGLNFDLELI